MTDLPLKQIATYEHIYSAVKKQKAVGKSVQKHTLENFTGYLYSVMQNSSVGGLSIYM